MVPLSPRIVFSSKKIVKIGARKFSPGILYQTEIIKDNEKEKIKIFKSLFLKKNVKQ